LVMVEKAVSHNCPCAT